MWGGRVGVVCGGAESGEKSNGFVCNNPVKNGKLTGGLFLEPRCVSEENELKSQRGDGFGEEVKELGTDCNPFLLFVNCWGRNRRLSSPIN